MYSYSKFLNLDSLECISCQKIGDVVIGDCSKRVECAPGLTRCMNNSFTVNLTAVTAVTTAAWMSGCGSESECLMTDSQLCQSIMELVKPLTIMQDLELNLTDCKTNCTDEAIDITKSKQVNLKKFD